MLEIAGSLGRPLPPITILGIESGSIRPEVGLSAALEDRFAEYIAAAVDFLAVSS